MFPKFSRKKKLFKTIIFSNSGLKWKIYLTNTGYGRNSMKKSPVYWRPFQFSNFFLSSKLHNKVFISDFPWLGTKYPAQLRVKKVYFLISLLQDWKYSNDNWYLFLTSSKIFWLTSNWIKKKFLQHQHTFTLFTKNLLFHKKWIFSVHW